MHPGCEDNSIIIRCQQDPRVSVRLYDPYFPDWATVGFSVQALAQGLDARLEAVEVWATEDDDLPEFITGLAADFRGWTGEREWRRSRVTVRASFHSGGHVKLIWDLRPATIETTWAASVTTWMDAGEQMTDLAADLTQLLRRAAGQPAPP